MPDTSPNLDLPWLLPAQAQKHVTHNEALQRLDLFVQLTVQRFDAETPPASPPEGRIWALGPAPTGDWAGQAGRLATFLGGAWAFLEPREGWRAWGLAEAQLRVWRGTGWAPLPMDDLPGLGIGTAHDGTNRLAVVSPATLLSHAGAGHQVKVNKATAGDTATLLFQDDWSGRAEMGLAGNDDFSIKVSPDGSAWTEALRISRNTGELRLPGGLWLDQLPAGPAVTQGATDATTGRLLKVGDFGTGTAIPLFGPTSLGARALPPGCYTYAAASTPGGPETAAWAHILTVAEAAAASTGSARRRVYTSYRSPGTVTGPSVARAWVGWDDGSGDIAWMPLPVGAHMVGTVRQSGGVPTGALIERGSNANGDYVRFADGTQICRQTLALSGGGSATITAAWVFPAAFYDTPAISTSLLAAPAAGTRERSYWQGSGTSSLNVNCSMNASWPANTSENHLVTATGRWF